MSQRLFFAPLGGASVPRQWGIFPPKGWTFAWNKKDQLRWILPRDSVADFDALCPRFWGTSATGCEALHLSSQVVATVFLTLWKRGCDICRGGLFCLTLKSSDDSATSLKSEADLQVLLVCFAGVAGVLWMGFGVGWDVLRMCGNEIPR